jgi:hypothetical protein
MPVFGVVQVTPRGGGRDRGLASPLHLVKRWRDSVKVEMDVSFDPQGKINIFIEHSDKQMLLIL